MYFKDLELCSYHSGTTNAVSWAVPLRAVGWLEHGEEFAVGATPAVFVARIEKFIGLTKEHFSHHSFRGLHECSLCVATGRQVSGLEDSWLNIFVPGRSEIYAAPGGLLHYVSEHSYLPPACFLEAISTCPDPGSHDYNDALERANAGIEPPFLPYEQAIAAWDANFEKQRALGRVLGGPLIGALRGDVIKAARTCWPELSLSDEAECVVINRLIIWFDETGRVIDAR